MGGTGALTQGLATKTQNNAINSAKAGTTKATGAGIDIMTQLLNSTQGDLAPFKGLAVPALEQASRLTFRDGRAAGVKNPIIAAPQPTAGGSGPYDFSSITKGLGSGTTDPLANLSEGELKALGIRENAPVQFGPGPGSVSNDFMGGIGSIFNHNSSKTAATLGVNELSSWTWNKLKPAMESGQIGKAEGREIFNTWWQQWIESMREAGVSPTIIESSVADQSRYIVKDFNDFLAGLPDTKAA